MTETISIRRMDLFACLAVAFAMAACSASSKSSPGAYGGSYGGSRGGSSATGSDATGGGAGSETRGGTGGAGAGGNAGNGGSDANTHGGASGSGGWGATGGSGMGGGLGAGGNLGGSDAASPKDAEAPADSRAAADMASPNSDGASADGAATNSTCPSTLPTLAADSDTSFYANKPDVPHGTVATVKYTSGSTTMHIYTPPDYASNTTATYPVLYLNHGVGETDAVYSCTTGGPECGYAGLILDNLLAANKAVPMIMVMTDTRDCASLTPATPPTDDACTAHYRQVLMPYVEKNYRVKADRDNRAIGGLSLGGIVTFNAGLSHLELFSQLFIYSSGFFDDTRATWEANMSSVFDDAKATNHLLNVPIYMAAGDTDVALANAKATRDVLVKHGIKVMWLQTTLGHEWTNWRRYLAQTLPLMFRNTSGCD